jgi:hypothetical protein
MTPVELRKQISIFVPLSDWRAIRNEAARQDIPMTELCRRWMKPQLVRLHRGEKSTMPAAASMNRNQPRNDARDSREILR